MFRARLKNLLFLLLTLLNLICLLPSCSKNAPTILGSSKPVYLITSNDNSRTVINSSLTYEFPSVVVDNESASSDVKSFSIVFNPYETYFKENGVNCVGPILTGTGEDHFRLFNNTCGSSQLLGESGKCSFSVAFAPTIASTDIETTVLRYCDIGSGVIYNPSDSNSFAAIKLKGSSLSQNFVLSNMRVWGSGGALNVTAEKDVTIDFELKNRYGTNYLGNSKTSNFSYAISEGTIGESTTDHVKYVNQENLTFSSPQIITSPISFALTLPLVEGGRRLGLWVKNGSGDILTRLTQDITIDLSPPGVGTLSITDPDLITNSSSISVAFSGGGSDTDSNFAFYEVTACTNSLCSLNCVTSATGDTSPITLTGLQDSYSYYLCIGNVDKSGNKSEKVSTTVATRIDTTSPTDPANVTPLSSTYGVVTFRDSYTPDWTHSTDDHFSYYELKACTNSSCSSSCTTTQTVSYGSKGSTALSGLSIRTNYYVCVRALDDASNSSSWVASSSLLLSERGLYTWIWGKPSGTGFEDFFGYNSTTDSFTKPPARFHSTAAIDSSDNIYIFGGYIYGLSSTGIPGTGSVGDDFWKWDGTNWTLLSGGARITTNGVYSGGIGVSDPLNSPGSRDWPLVWADKRNHIWLFGGNGRGYNSSSFNNMNDLWEWEGSAWRYWGGGITPNNSYYYSGTKGVASFSNWPRIRNGSSVYYDETTDSAYMFGGSAASGYLGDLWRFDHATQEWTWLSGADQATINSYGVYDTSGAFNSNNMISARYLSGISMDETGDIIVIAGYGYGSSGSAGTLNDTWIYNISSDQWKWAKGTGTINLGGVCGGSGITDPTYYPSARNNGRSTCKSINGITYIFGGRYNCAGTSGAPADLWKFQNGDWTFLEGSTATTNSTGTWGNKGITSASTLPPSHPSGHGSMVCSKMTANKLYLLPGNRYNTNMGTSAAYSNAIFTYDGADWTWVYGDKSPHFPWIRAGAIGVSDPSNDIGTRYGIVNALVHPTVDTTTAYFFGGYVADPSSDVGYFNDLWGFDGVNFINYHAGTPSGIKNTIGVYGAVGDASTEYYPGSRYYHTTWLDTSGDLWIFGGIGYTTGASGRLNDLLRYRFSDQTWTLMGGTTTVGNAGNYNSQGSYSATAYPRASQWIVTVIDASGDPWFFGGYTGSNRKNDFWTYSHALNQFKWVGGTSAVDTLGDWGTLNVPNVSNVVSARYSPAMWIDATGDIFLFGGNGFTDDNTVGYLNDMWKWDGTNWTWIGGSKTKNQLGVYGPKDATDASYWPGSGEFYAVQDSSYNVYLFIKYGCGASNCSRYLSDVWKWDGQYWSWIGGSKTENTRGNFNYKGLPSESSEPPAGGAYGAIWVDATGDIWIFGGGTYDAYLNNVGKNTIWKFTPP